MSGAPLSFDDALGADSAGLEDRDFGRGVAMVDVNGDGLLDIFITNNSERAGGTANGVNHLFINNGDKTFNESTSAGLNAPSSSVGLCFADIDNDQVEICCDVEVGGRYNENGHNRGVDIRK